MASGLRACPECGTAVSLYDAGCPSCGRILERATEAAGGAQAGEVEAARSGGTGWTSLVLAGCGCLVLAILLVMLFVWVSGS
jgi:hypothetical protein